MDKALQRINDRFKDNFNLESLLIFKQEVNDEQMKLKEKLHGINGEVSTRISTVLKKVDQQRSKLNKLLMDLDNLQTDVIHHSEKVHHVHKITEEYINKISMLERTGSYLNILAHIEEISQSIEDGLSDRGGRSISQYCQLCSLSNRLNNSECINLVKHLHGIVTYWHSVLKDQYGKEFEEVLKLLKWPFVAANVPPVPSSEVLIRWQNLTEILFQIQLPETLLNTMTLPDDARQLSLPILLLVRPFKKRFIFHFSGAKQTNSPDKPEWYFTQILNWLKEHLEFVEKHLQPVYNRLSEKKSCVRLEFTLGLVQLAMEKLHNDLPHLQFDDALFSHTVDEALGFATELREGYGYPSSEPGVLSVLTQAHFFVKWLHLEKKYSLEKLDAIMRSETAFQSCSLFQDDDFTTECVDKFLTLLSTITERYQYLSQPGHRLTFLQLQLDLLDDFRVRLLQLLRAQEDEDQSTASSTMILNSVSSLIYVLQQWGDSPHFLELQYYRQQLDQEQQIADDGVFQDVIALLTTMQEDLLDNLTGNLSMEAKSTSRPYRKDRWHAMDEPEDGVTSSSIRMFNVLTTGLCSLHDALTPRLRMDALKRVAKSLDSFLFEELVMQVKFSANGSARFALDVRRGLLPLFGQYSAKPQALFPLISDSCALLSLSRGSAELLKSALEDPREGDYMTNDVLADVDVTTLNASQALQVLLRRLDLLIGDQPYVNYNK